MTMLRRAVIQKLRDSVSALNSRVYQAFLAPANGSRPYATVKIPAARGSINIGFAGAQPVEVRVYDDQTSFIDLDSLEQAIRTALHGKEINDQNEKYYLQWVPAGGDFVDEEYNLIGRLVMFEAALLYERG
jgi:hypothetical protein